MNTLPLRTATLVPALWLAFAGLVYAQPACLTWEAPEVVMPLSRQTYFDHIAAGIDGQGRAMVAYVDRIDAAPGGSDDVLYVRRRDAGHVWADVQELDRGGAAMRFQNLSLAVGRQGDALLSWRRAAPVYGDPGQTRALGYSPATGWQPPYTFMGAPSDAPVTAVGPSGDGLMLYRDLTQGNAVKSVSWTASQGYGAPQSVSARPWSASRLSVAVNADGQAVAVGDVSSTVMAVRRAGRDGAWGPEEVLGPGNILSRPPSIQLNAGGTAMVAWRHRRMVLLRRFDPLPQAWAEVDIFDEPGTAHQRAPSVALNDAGQAELSWLRTTVPPYSRYHEVMSSRYQPGQDWVAAAHIDAPAKPVVAQWLGMAPDGTSLLMWRAGELGMALRTASGEAQRLQQDINPRRVAFSDQGHVLVLFVQRDASPRLGPQLMAQRGRFGGEPGCGR